MMRTQKAAKVALPRLTQLLTGYRLSSVLVAACELGVFVALREQSLTHEELARTCASAPDALLRLLRVLQALGLVSLRGDRVRLSSRGRLLLPDESSLADSALLAAQEYVPLWSALATSVRQGRSAAVEVFGCSTWEHRQRHPALNAAFNRLMTTGQAPVAAALTRAVTIPAGATIVDVGGGSGALLIELLRQLPQAQGIVLEQAHVVPAARAAVRDAGLAARCHVRQGSFFRRVPADAEVYVLQHVLHDFDDDQALAILRCVRRALRPDALLLVIENLLPETGTASLDTLILDLHMLVTHDGRERARTQFQALFAAAGLSASDCTLLAGARHVLTARTGIDG